jgi:hypothetical protein
MQMDHHMFDNVFVNPEAYQAFEETGTWPDKTMLVLEARGAQSKGSINQAGNYQGTDVMAREVHVKDEARFPGKWAFFGFGNGKTAKMIPLTADCYSCHAAHAAVDTTFVQFYPTLLPIAQAKGTLSPSYRKEVGASTPIQQGSATATAPMADAYPSDKLSSGVMGNWQGTLATNNRSFHVVVHIWSDKNAHLVGTVDSLDENVGGQSVTAISLNGSDLHFEVASIGGIYDGKIDAQESAIGGTWKQGGESLPLAFQRVGK